MLTFKISNENALAVFSRRFKNGNSLPSSLRFWGLFFTFFTFFLMSSGELAAQGPNKTKLGKVEIPEENDEWEIVKKEPITTFKPVEMKDKTGKPLNPNQTQKIKNKTVTNKALNDELNDYEKRINKRGHSLHDKATRVMVVPKGQDELEKQESLEPSEGNLKTKEERAAQTSGEIEIGNQKVKTLDKYSDQEFSNIRKKAFKVQPSGDLQLTDGGVGSNAAPGTLLKTLNYDKAKNWTYGSTGKFKVSLDAKAKLTGKYFQPAGEEKNMTQAQINAALRQTQTEFRVNATGKTRGWVLGKEFTIADASIEGYLPFNSAKKATVKGTVKLAGSTVLNLNKEFSTSFNESGRKSLSHTWGHEFNTTLLGIPVSGEVGLKGEIGIDYRVNGVIPLILVGYAEPFAKLTGYAEASVDILIAEAGVRASLVFARGSVPIDIFAMVIVGDNVLLHVGLEAGYKLEFLSGKVVVFVEVLGVGAKEWVVFDWSGVKREGSFVTVSDKFTFNW